MSRRSNLAWWLCCLWAMGTVGAAPSPSVPVGAPLPFANMDFEAGRKHWSNGLGETDIVGNKGRENSHAALIKTEHLSRVFEVSRGSVTGEGQRYLIRLYAKAHGDDGMLRVRTRASAGVKDRHVKLGSSWQEISVITDTHAMAPGAEQDRIILELNATADGVWLDEVQVRPVPNYGLWLRVGIVESDVASPSVKVNILRRHRDKGHRDAVRHRYFSGVDLGRYSDLGSMGDWHDLRRHLFGRSEATMTLVIGDGNKRADCTVRVECAMLMTKPDTPDVTTDDDDMGLGDGDDGDELALEAPTEVVPTPTMLWTGELQSKEGMITFLVPENECTPKDFVKRFRGLDADIKRREAMIAQYVAPACPPKLIPVGANLSPVDRVLDSRRQQKEIEILRRIGLNSVHLPNNAPFVSKGCAYAANGRRIYSRVEELSHLSPFAGDALAEAMDAHFAKLAKSLGPAQADPETAIHIVELFDEPGDLTLGEQDLPAFREYLKTVGETAQSLGVKSLADVVPSGYSPEAAVARPMEPAAEPMMAMPGTDGALNLEPEEEPAQETEENKVMSAEAKRLFYHSKRFATMKTSAFLGAATKALNKHLPGVRSTVNFRAGVRNVLLPETADWFRIGRDASVTMMWNEDWLNTYGWRRDGIQLVSYYTELMRTSARKRELPMGGFMIMMGHATLRSYSALAHGSRYLHYWRYGPNYANNLPYSWSHSTETVKAIAAVCRDVSAVEGTLVDATREPSKAALLYAPNDPLWGRGRSENWRVYMALLHAQVPVDIITEADVEEDDLLAQYQLLYVTDVSIREATLQKIAAWYAGGGALWLGDQAAMRDEYDQPSSIVDEALGVRRVSVPIRKLTLAQGGYEVSSGSRLANAQSDNVRDKFSDGTVAVVRKGNRYQLNMWAPGDAYFAPVRARYNRGVSETKGQIQSGWVDERRGPIVDFALKMDAMRSVTLDQAAIEAIRYTHPKEELVFLINYTGRDLERPVKVRVKTDFKPKKVNSLRHADLPFVMDGDQLEVDVALQLGDVLRLHR